MGEASDRIKQDIEQTRAELTQDTDRLVSHVDPRQMIDRRTQRMRDKARRLRDRVMGSAPSLSSSEGGVRENLGQAANTVRSAPQRVVRQARGNPLAAGLIAFGAGLLAASLISESQAERRAARQLRERAGGAIEPAKQAVAESADSVRRQAAESAREAGGHLKDSASEATRSTGEHARNETRSASEEMRGS